MALQKGWALFPIQQAELKTYGKARYLEENEHPDTANEYEKLKLFLWKLHFHKTSALVSKSQACPENL
ncbi:hypothetical protein HCH52_03905 [Oscillospiraceae bacterium HV4-5-C5C]|nr:hypothetical protein [Oscillospiraceae bacterium HV4-5-C5C]